ncbi:MAG: elongation factor P lysine(34) lysyltransferase [Gammaproteobacteria bacterium]|nr:elongation factor P lysine(34) lysyltransferase [Gammaproteobacteria bacterium]
MTNWKPGASSQVLKQRAELFANLRAFFFDKGIIEVETPVLAGAPVTDLHIQSLTTEISFGNSSKTFYLQTSPEFAMKRLLADNPEPIYQIGKVFRDDPVSKHHNPEFTMLEWYRPGFSMEQLMDEVAELLAPLLESDSFPKFSYRELFETHLNINPHQVGAEEISSIVQERIELNASELEKTDYLQLLMTTVIEPQLPSTCFVYDYPKEQASLAVIEKNVARDIVAKRFEVYCQGMELANGYYELIDVDEQRQRFEADNNARQAHGLEVYPIDEKFLASLESGMPSCSGVALGIDRLFMAIHNIENIDKVISFSLDRV